MFLYLCSKWKTMGIGDTDRYDYETIPLPSFVGNRENKYLQRPKEISGIAVLHPHSEHQQLNYNQLNVVLGYLLGSNMKVVVDLRLHEHEAAAWMAIDLRNEMNVFGLDYVFVRETSHPFWENLGKRAVQRSIDDAVDLFIGEKEK